MTTTEQRQQALKLANRRRAEIAELKARARGGAHVVERMLEVAGNKFVGEVLMWVPGIGEWRAVQIMREAGCSPLRRCRQLTVRQRVVIAAFALESQRCQRGDFRHVRARA